MKTASGTLAALDPAPGPAVEWAPMYYWIDYAVLGIVLGALLLEIIMAGRAPTPTDIVGGLVILALVFTFWYKVLPKPEEPEEEEGGEEGGPAPTEAPAEPAGS